MVETLAADISDDVQTRILGVLKRACDPERPLVTAESCTGGLLASVLTDVDGCSHAFERGFVVYTDDAKTEMLGVSPELLAECGAVARPVAIEMAEGALARSTAHCALSVTGFAGPAGDAGEEGLVHFACAVRGRQTRHRQEKFGAIGRGGVRHACLNVALEMFEEALE